MEKLFDQIELHVPVNRLRNWDQFMREAPEYSIGIEVMDDTPGNRGHYVHFDHHAGVIREATMSAAMQAYIAVRQGGLMDKWLKKRRPIPVYVWNADQDVCLTAFVLEYHYMLERAEGTPLLRWIVQYNNKIDVCGGLYPVSLDELVQNHFTWVFEPYLQQRKRGKTAGDEALVSLTIRQVCDRLLALLEGRAGITPITARPEILYASPYNFIIADEKGDPNSRLVLASQGHTNLISRVCTRPNGRHTYSLIRGSPYDDDVFNIPKLIEAFQAAEDLPNVSIWGGSNLAAGSDSELGSSLDWTTLRDIAEPIVGQAYLASAAAEARPAMTEMTSRPRILLAMDPDSRGRLTQYLEECDAEVFAVANCADACRFLGAVSRLDAIFTAPMLPDGSFQSLLRVACRYGDNIPAVVCVKKLDGGWIDLLEAGAFQLLEEPYDRERVARVMADLAARKAAPAAAPQ